MPIGPYPDIDYTGRINAIRTIGHALGVNSASIPSNFAADSGFTSLHWINKIRAAMALSPLPGLDHNGFVKAINDLAGLTGGTGTGMAPPSGYTSGDLIFEDQFTNPSLNTANWNPYMALNGIRWQGNNDDLAYPYSAIGNLPGGNNVEYGDPYPYGYSTDNGAGIHMVGGAGLSLIASPDTHEPDYTWAGAYVSGTQKLAIMPASGGYLQIRAKMPDSTHGGWGSLWMMPESPGTGNEMDLQETGFTTSGIPVNQQMASSIHSGPELFSNVGVDTSADYHTYGLEYIPGVSVKTYFDGALQQTWTSGVSTGAYEVILSMTMWGGDPSIHTLADPVHHPGPYTMNVNDVQIYKYPP